MVSRAIASGGGTGTITFVGSTSSIVAAGSAGMTPTLPAGLAAGDVILLGVTASSGVVTGWGEASYAGWTIVEDLTVTSEFFRVLYRVATGSDTGPAMTFTGTAGGVAVSAAYRGVDTTTPFIVEGGQVQTVSQTTQDAPAATNTDANAWGVYIAAARQVASPLSWTPGAGLTERVDQEIGTANTNNAASELSDTNGAIATGTYTFSGSTSTATARSCMWAGILRPAGGGGPTTQSGTLDISAAATVTIGGTQEFIAALAPNAAATPTISGTRGQSAALAPSAAATPTIGGVREQPAALAPSVTATSTIGGIQEFIRTLAVSAVATPTIGPDPITHSHALSASATTSTSISGTRGPVAAESASATATAGWQGIQGFFVALSPAATASPTIGGTQTFFRALAPSAVATPTITPDPISHSHALAPTAAATVLITVGTAGALAPSAAATPTIAGLRTAMGTLAPTAVASTTIAGIRSQVAALAPSVVATPTIAGIWSQLAALSVVAPAQVVIFPTQLLAKQGALAITATATFTISLFQYFGHLAIVSTPTPSVVTSVPRVSTVLSVPLKNAVASTPAVEPLVVSTAQSRLVASTPSKALVVSTAAARQVTSTVATT